MKNIYNEFKAASSAENSLSGIIIIENFHTPKDNWKWNLCVLISPDLKKKKSSHNRQPV